MRNKMSSNSVNEPNLRFSEFGNDASWKKLDLASVASFVNEKVPFDQILLKDYVSTENILPNFSGVITAFNKPSSGSGTKYKENDILVSNIRPYLKKIWRSNRVGCASNDIIVIRNKDTLTDLFISSLLASDNFIDYIMKGAQGVKMPRGDIDLIKKYPVWFPPNKAEQQKIADCLTSLGDLISGEEQKLEALQRHKKGLVQELLPAAGETLPKRRFPEFEDEPEWEIRPLGDCAASIVASGDLNTEYFSKATSDQHIYPVYSNAVENDGLYGYYSVSKYPSNSITITARGNIGTAFLREKPFMGIGRLIVVACRNGIEPYFLKECWNFRALIPKEVTSVPQLTAITAKSVMLPIPGWREQKRIANLLYSVDLLVTSQREKLIGLRQHKKALLQQLFPAVGEAQHG